MLPFHPFAEIFPLIEGRDFDALVADVKAQGLVDPVETFEGMVLDGRNRSRACAAAGIEPHFHVFEGTRDQALAYVISKNLKRRHLNDDQRRMAAARLASLAPGRPSEKTSQNANISRVEAATILSVDVAGVDRAKAVLATAAPEIRDAVDKGKLTVAAAHSAAKLPAETQRKIADEAMAGRANVVRTVIKKEARSAKEAALGAQQRALPEKKYGVIYADPEWQFEVYSRDTGLDRSADNHYPTTDTLEIVTRPVAKIADKDCVLFLWATAPMLPQALRVMGGWGFEYKSQIIWRKDRTGTGYWFRNEHEILLVGTRGKVPAPAMGTQWGSVVDAPVGRHSEKPDAFYELIEAYFPNLPKIELNARRARAGWDAWGLEAPTQAEASPTDAAGQPIAHDEETGEVV